MKTFVAISTEIYNDKLILVNTSCGLSLFNESGLEFGDVIEFLFNLKKQRLNRKEKVVFVCFGFSRDNEFIFSGMSKNSKDKLFQSHIVKKELHYLESEQERLDEIFYNADKETQDFEQADFDRYVNKLAQIELLEVKHKDYKIDLANGKRLTVRKNKEAINIYDIYGFFKPSSLRKTAKLWLGQDIALLERNLLSHLPEIEALKIYSDIEVKTIAEIATALNKSLVDNGIKLQRYHGATAITSQALTQAKAKDFFHNYRYKRQLSPELYNACYGAYFGGRGEQLKIGTIENVNIYDINSAYAYASLFLPTMLKRPRFSRKWKPEMFSLWFCEFDLSGSDMYYGLLPYRFNSQTIWKSKGRGYYWQPEVSFLLANYPEHITVKHGYFLQYEQAPFTTAIQDLYNLRQQLSRQNSPLAKVLKIALASIYGKFCQHNGRGHYYNMFYAGFITSFVRTMLLNAVKGNERETVCFSVDAIHTTAHLDLPISDDLGDYKLLQVDKATYIENGVYKLYKDNEVIKTASKGSRHFNFDRALDELNNKKQYSALIEFFIGHNIFTSNAIRHSKYLQNFATDKTLMPLDTRARLFDVFECDLNTGFVDSRISTFDNGLPSGIYKHSDFKDADAGLDTIEARRI